MGDENVVKYGDGAKSHGMKGSVVPKSTARPVSDEEFEGAEVLQQVGGGEDAGGVVDVNQVIPQNIIEMNADGSLKRSYVLDEAGMKRLKASNTMTKANPNPRPVSYAMAAGVGDASVVQARSHTVFKRKNVELDLADSVEVEDAPALPSAPSAFMPVSIPIKSSWVDHLAGDLNALISAPRVKVRFKGQFGSLSVIYNHVHKEEFYLVMLQYAEDSEFYEAPSGEQQVLVEYDLQRYTCFPGPQFRLLPGGKIMVTVYMIEQEQE